MTVNFLPLMFYVLSAGEAAIVVFKRLRLTKFINTTHTGGRLLPYTGIG